MYGRILKYRNLETHREGWDQVVIWGITLKKAAERRHTKQQHRVWLKLRNLEPDSLGLNIVFVILITV